MSLYLIVYDFIYSLLDGLPAMEWEIGGVSIDLQSWITCTASLIVVGVLLFTAFKFVWWLVRLVGNGFMLRG